MTRRICILVLAVICLLAGCGRKDSGNASSGSKKDDNSKKDNSSMSSSEDISDSDTVSDGSRGTAYETKESSFSGQLSLSNTSASETEKEIIPSADDAYKLNPMTGGADREAAALRSKILNAGDNLNITGTVYYVSSVRGNDDNDGLSPEKPFKSLGKIQSTTLNAGDGVLLERGSIFRLTGTFSCKNGVTYGAYGEGNKPAVYGSSMNFAKGYFWSPSDIKNVWKISFPFNGDVGIIVFNHGEHGSNRTDYIRLLEKNGDFYMDSTTGQLYIYCDKGNPGLKYYSIEIGTRMILFNLPSYNASDIMIDNICFKYSGNFAIRSSINAKNITVTNCEIGWIGGSLQPDGLNVYGNGIEFLGGIKDSVVKNCWIYQIFDSAITFQGRNDTKDYTTAYKNVAFSENLLEYCGMAGLEWWTSTEPNEDTVIEDISFDNNIIRFTGYGWVKGAVRGARAIQGPWSRNVFINMKNFRITDNIIDCALGGMYSFPFDTAPDPQKHIMMNNTYYQKATPTNTLNRFGEYQYGSGQTDFENAVHLMEKSPKLVKWLD